MKIEDIEQTTDRTVLLHWIELFGLQEAVEEAGLLLSDDNDNDNDNVLDDLRAFLISFAMTTTSHFEQVSEWMLLYGLSYELVMSMLESNQYMTTWEMLEDFQSLSSGTRQVLSDIIRVDVSDTSMSSLSLPSRLMKGKVLVLLVNDAEIKTSIEVSSNNQAISSTVQLLDTTNMNFGCHHMRITIDSPVGKRVVEGDVLITTPLYEFNLALDAMMDVILWGWEGQFTSDLENAMLQLLVFTHDDLNTMIQQWKTMFRSLMQNAGEDLEQLMTLIVEDLHQALSKKSAYAIGRLQQHFIQFLEMKESIIGAMIHLPAGFFDAIRNYLEVKVAASPQERLVEKLRELVKASRLLFLNLSSTYTAGSSTYGWLMKLQEFLHKFEHASFLSLATSTSTENNQSSPPVITSYALTKEDILAIFRLKPKSTEAIFQVANTVNNDELVHLPTIPLHQIFDSKAFNNYIEQYAVTLFEDVINIGSMMGFALNDANGIPPSLLEQVVTDSDAAVEKSVLFSATLINRILEYGLTYACSNSEKLIILYPTIRSAQLLRNPVSGELCFPTSTLATNLIKQYRDLARIFRTKKQKTLSLRLNTNFVLALSKLRAHHAQDCWIGPNLEKVWAYLLSVNQLWIFELWYGDELIAADFTHPICDGKMVYVATRFFEREQADIRHLKPGFLLGLVECGYLQSHGCYLWDLGGVDLCPLMRYKNDLVGEGKERPMALAEFHSIAQTTVAIPNAGTLLKSGILIEDIDLSHVYGYSHFTNTNSSQGNNAGTKNSSNSKKLNKK